MQQTPNFNSKQIISKEELTLWDESVRELVGNVLRYNRNSDQVGGILDGYDSVGTAFINDFFKVEIGSVPSGGFNTIKIGRGRGVLNFESTTDEFIAGLTTNNDSLKKQLVTLFKYEETDNIVVDGISGYASGDVIYIGFVPIWNPLEDGLCALTTSNQVTITGGDFTKLRGQSTKNPTKIRFYNQDGTPANNSETYEVVSILSDTQIIISGVLSNETNLKFMIVGSYDLSAQGSLTNKYSYVTATGQLTFTDTASDITSIGGFLIASLTFASGGAFSINDLRVNNLFNFAYSPDIVYKSIAQTITGAKTFAENSPIFAIKVNEVFEPLSKVTPLEIDAITHNLTISAGSDGMIYKIKGTEASYFLLGLYFTDTYVEGDHIFLYIDPTGENINIQSNAGAHRLLMNSNSSSNVNHTLAKGAMIELIADENLCWHIVNSNIIASDTDWFQVNSLLDSTSTPLSPATNVVKYKTDNNMLFVYIETLAAVNYPVTFSLPYAGQKVRLFFYNYVGTQASITLNDDGTCSIYCASPLGDAYYELTIHL